MTSAEAAASIKSGILEACPNAIVNSIPISDGGEGLCEAVAQACRAGSDTT
jgi:glycerate kinase